MSRQHGTALSEAIVGLLAILPAFWAVDHLGRLHDMQRAAVAGARYAAWEETVGRGAGAGVDRAIEDRIHGSDRTGLVGDHGLETWQPAPNPLWRDRLGGLRAEPESKRQQTRRTGDGSLPTTGIAVRTIAHGDSVPGLAGLGGLSGDMLGLKREAMPGHRVNLAVKPRLEARRRPAPIQLEASAAISPGAWQALDDRHFQRRTERIVASEPINTISQPAQQLSRFFVFKEGRYARSTDFIPPSRILPGAR